MTTQPSHLSSAQIEQVVRVLSRAFYDDPVWRYMTPDDEARLGALTWMMRACIRYGLLYGEVYTNDAADGAAIWISPGNTTMTFGKMLRTGMLTAAFKLGWAGCKRMMNVMDCTEKAHKRSAPGRHWYLLILGIEPSRQGKGIGGQLIQPILARADAEGLPCYLETMNERTLPFYERHGFKVTEKGQIPKGGPNFWAMVREPRKWRNPGF